VEEWNVSGSEFPTKEKALKAAGIIQITESRLTSVPRGPRYDIETEIYETGEGWRVKWRKVFAGYDSGCGKCSSCSEVNTPSKPGNKSGKLIEFKRKRQDNK